MEKIHIVKVGRKEQPSKFKPGETYSITTVLDNKNRKLVAMGKWAENWKIGDEIEATIEEKKWTDKDGFEQVNLNLKNPNQKEFTPGGSNFNPKISAFQIAATLAPLLFAGKKKVMLKDIVELAEEIRKHLDITPAAVTPEPKKEEEKVKEIDVDAEEKDAEVGDEEDDTRPF